MGGVAPARPPFPRSPRLACAMHITNIGGSLTTAVCLSLIAWSIRVLRAQQLAEEARDAALVVAALAARRRAAVARAVP